MTDVDQIACVEGAVTGLSPLPDETLFSWCSRYHRLSANGADWVTCQQLFAHPRIGAGHDFPARIDIFAQRTAGAMGSALEIIQHKTLLPYYLPFKSKEMVSESIRALRGDGIAHLKYRLGLLTSGLGAAHPLKGCPDCVAEDSVTHGWSYWHREHQLPGVWVCRKHQCPLRIAHYKSRAAARFSWVVPVRGQLQTVALLDGMGSGSQQHAWLDKLARLSCALLKCRPVEFCDADRINHAIRLRMEQRGLTSPRGRVRWLDTYGALQGIANNLQVMPDLAQQATADVLRAQLGRLLSGRSLTHPLRYAVWITAWFDDMDDFQKSYRLALGATADASAAPDRIQVTASIPASAASGTQADAVMQQVRAGAMTVSAAAKVMGVAYATAAVRASREHFVVTRRPKKITADLWNHAIHLLRAGTNKADVAKACCMSEVSVTRILRTVDGLQDQWHQIRHAQRGEAAKRAWSTLAALAGYMGVNELRRIEPAAYAWLYRNDRGWLQQSTVQRHAPSAQNNAAKRSERADQRMADAIQQVALSVVQSSQRLSMAAIKRSVPAVGRVIRHPQRWPLAVEVLKKVLAMPRLGSLDLWGQ